MRQHYGYPFAPIQILTGDIRKACGSRRGRLHDDGRSFQRKSRIERRFESLPGVQRVATLGVFLRYFLHAAKSNQNRSLFGNARGFANLNSARQNKNFAQTKLKPFAALGGILPAAMPPFLLLTQHFLPLRGLFFGGHAAFLCCLRQPTAALRRLLFPTFCKVQKVGQKTLKISCRKFYPAGTARFACTAPPKAASQKNAISS